MRNSLIGFVDAAIKLFGFERGDGSSGGLAKSSTRLGYRLIIDGPIVVSDYESNQAKSGYCADRIIGGHIKDALFKSFSIKSSQVNDGLYDDIVFTDALWAMADAPVRTVPIPLSVAVAKVGNDMCVVDAATCEDAKFITMNGLPKMLTMEQFEGLDKTEHTGHMAYRPSWTDLHKEAAEQVFSRVWKVPSAVSQRLKLSSAIAKNSWQLQSNDCELSGQQVWLGDIDLSGVDASQRAQVLKRLKQALRSNEVGLGKSKTPVKFELCAEPHKTVVSLPPKNEVVRLLLVSAAPILPNTIAAGGTNSFSSLEKYYQDYFGYASNGLLQLSTYYASQRMAGGAQFQRHYVKNKAHYRPELLTEEGSVFVLRRSAVATDVEIVRLLRDWSDRGLPNAEDRVGHTWRNHPFVRENGYSEVRINYPAITPQVATSEHRRTW